MAFALALGQQVSQPSAGYEVLDSRGVPVRTAKRRGRGQLAGQAALGWCTRVGWVMARKLLRVVSRAGAMTGYGLGPGTSGDQLLAETRLSARQPPSLRLPGAGHSLDACYSADKGEAGSADPTALGAERWSAGAHPTGAAASAALATGAAAVAGGLA